MDRSRQIRLGLHSIQWGKVGINANTLGFLRWMDQTNDVLERARQFMYSFKTKEMRQTMNIFPKQSIEDVFCLST